MAAATPADIRAALGQVRWEDAAIALWLAIVAPLLQLAAPAGPTILDSGDQPLRGVLYVLGAVGAIVCLGTRPVDAPPTLARILGSDEWVIGPLIGGLVLLLSLGVDLLGGDGSALLLPVLAGSIIVAVLASRLPSVSTQARRLLILPFVLGASDLFQSIMATVDPGSLLRGTTTAGSFDLFTLELMLVLGGAAVFYVMLIYAPRQVAEREGTRLGWITRFGVFIASSLVGLGWLRLA